MRLGVGAEGPPNRWNSETGLYMGFVASALMAAVVSAPFAGWLALRRRAIGPIRPPFAIPLAFGIIQPLLCVAPLMIVVRYFNNPAVSWLIPLLIFGSPIVAAEISARLSRDKMQKSMIKDDRDFLGV